MTRVCVIGVGGVGGTLAAYLFESGEVELVLIARGERGEALREKGLELRECKDVAKGEATRILRVPTSAMEVYATVEEAVAKGAKPVDYAIVSVKTWQVDEAAAQVALLLAPGGSIVTTQNGVEAPAAAARHVGFNRVLGGTTYMLSLVTAPGIVSLQVPMWPFYFGEVYSAEGEEIHDPRSARAERLEQLFTKSGTQCQVPRDGGMWSAIWGKASHTCCHGPVAALTRAPLNRVVRIPETRALLKAASMEVVRCAITAGHMEKDGKTVDELAEAVCVQLEQLPPGSTNSTTRDILTGCPSELHELTGGIQRQGRKLGVPTPTHDFIMAALLPQELRARGLDTYELMGIPGGAPHVARTTL